MTTSKIELPVGGKRLSVSIYSPGRKSPNWMLFLFGGSRTRGKERFAQWQKTLTQENIGSVSFDYSGTGKSSGNFFASSLANRINETVAIIRWMKKRFGHKIQLTLCGGSMGAYVALGASRIFTKSIKNLILFCPAAYARESHFLCFGPKFSDCIRQSKSWKNSLSFGWIQQFTGKILFLVPENDEIVPTEIPREYFRLAQKASEVKYITIPSATHNLLNAKTTNSKIRRLVYKYSTEFIKESL